MTCAIIDQRVKPCRSFGDNSTYTNHYLCSKRWWMQSGRHVMQLKTAHYNISYLVWNCEFRVGWVIKLTGRFSNSKNGRPIFIDSISIFCFPLEKLTPVTIVPHDFFNRTSTMGMASSVWGYHCIYKPLPVLQWADNWNMLVILCLWRLFLAYFPPKYFYPYGSRFTVQNFECPMASLHWQCRGVGWNIIHIFCRECSRDGVISIDMSFQLRDWYFTVCLISNLIVEFRSAYIIIII